MKCTRKLAAVLGLSVVMTASIVARFGWIIPEPLAIPPTVKPPPWETAVFACVSVVRIASAASSPWAIWIRAMSGVGVRAGQITDTSVIDRRDIRDAEVPGPRLGRSYVGVLTRQPPAGAEYRVVDTLRGLGREGRRGSPARAPLAAM